MGPRRLIWLGFFFRHCLAVHSHVQRGNGPTQGVPHPEPAANVTAMHQNETLDGKRFSDMAEPRSVELRDQRAERMVRTGR